MLVRACVYGRASSHLYEYRPRVSLMLQYFKRPWVVSRFVERVAVSATALACMSLSSVSMLARGQFLRPASPSHGRCKGAHDASPGCSSQALACRHICAPHVTTRWHSTGSAVPPASCTTLAPCTLHHTCVLHPTCVLPADMQHGAAAPGAAGQCRLAPGCSTVGQCIRGNQGSGCPCHLSKHP